MILNTFDKPLEEVTEADLLSLVEDQVSEKRIIEYKRELPSGLDEAKKEFLADISSFANAAGGHLVFGVPEDGGLPTAITGVSCSNPDQEILRLENLIRDGIQPRIQGVSIREIHLTSGTYIFILRIPRSWSLPHVVNYRGHWRFYSRNSAGKYPLDVMEVRSSFIQSGVLADKIRSFHNERLGSIISDQTPVRLPPGARVVLHLIPYISFDAAASFPIDTLSPDPWFIRPINWSVSDSRYNIDGFLTVSHNGGEYARGYVQVFRNGIIEAVDCSIMKIESEKPYIPSIVFERELISATEIYLSVQKKMVVPAPIVVMLSLLGVSGYFMAVKPSLNTWGEHRYPIDRDSLHIPEIILETYPTDVSRALKPAFDAVWNATGWSRSLSYNDEGEWGKGRNFIP